MCFSATAFLDMLRLGKDFDAVVDSNDFVKLYAQRLDFGLLGCPSPNERDQMVDTVESFDLSRFNIVNYSANGL